MKVIEKVDFLVTGAGIGGCLFALRAAKRGYTAALADSGEVMAREIASRWRVWADSDCFAGGGPLAELGLTAEPASGGVGAAELPLFTGETRMSCFKALHDAGVHLLMKSAPAGLALGADGRCRGAVLANKYGAHLISASALFDATDTAVLLSHAAGRPAEYSPEQTLSYGFELGGAAEPAGLPLTLDLGETGRVTLHRSKRENTVSARLDFRFVSGLPALFRYDDFLYAARLRVCEVVRLLRERVPELAGASISELADAVKVGAVVYPDAPETPGLRCLRAPLPFDFTAADLDALSKSVDEALDALIPCIGVPGGTATLRGTGYIAPLDGCLLPDVPEDPFLPVRLRPLRLPVGKLSTSASCRLLVAGCGAAGAAAALSASEELRPGELIAVDALSMPGGTRTVGEVTGFWHGYRGGNCEKLYGEIKEFAKSLPGLRMTFAEALYYTKTLRERGCLLLSDAVIFDADVSNGRVAGVVAATPLGCAALRAPLTLDTTSDGDVAVFAGAEYDYADPRDGNVQSYSMWGVDPEKKQTFRECEYKGDFDAVDGRYYSDFLRGLYLAHIGNSPYRFTYMLTVREARHICGDYTLTLRDVILARSFSDTAAVGYCPFDSHGRCSTHLQMLGLNQYLSDSDEVRDIKIRIPYRIFLPKGLDGLLVGGKAISATRDAACLIRMNPEMMNAGYMLGKACVLALRYVVSPRDIPLGTLQTQMRDAGVLPDWSVGETGEPDVCALAAELARTGDPRALVKLTALPRETALPVLEYDFARSADAPVRLELAEALAWFGSPSGLELLIERLGGSPGPATEARLLYLAGRCALHSESAKKRFLPVLKERVGKAEAGGSSLRPLASVYDFSKVSSRRIPNFNLVNVIAHVCETLASRELLPELDELRRKEYIAGEHISRDVFHNTDVFTAFQYVRLTAAAARCGSLTALRELAAQLHDTRAGFKLFIRGELTDITGIDLGFDSARWSEHAGTLTEVAPKPFESLPTELELQ